MNTNELLKEAVLKVYEANQKLSVKWDCGGDEAIVSVFLDDRELSYNEAFVQDFDLYLINKLFLPSAGEFSMEGGGNLSIEKGDIYLEYESIMKGYEGFDEEFNSTGWQELDEIDESYSGKIRLFDE